MFGLLAEKLHDIDGYLNAFGGSCEITAIRLGDDESCEGNMWSIVWYDNHRLYW